MDAGTQAVDGKYYTSMPRKLLKRLLPDTEYLRRHKHLRHFGELLQNHSLWRLNRRSVSGGVAVGLFVALLPVPFQMIIAAAMAIMTSVNLPISVALVFITNPLTMGPVFYFAYRVGAALLGLHPRLEDFQGPLEHILGSMLHIWKPLLLGSLLVGVLLGATGWAVVRLVWRWHVVSRRWPNR